MHIGRLIVDGTRRWRSDQISLGGCKGSGMGHESRRFATRGMAEQALLARH
jgi:hypothetical protein